MDQVGTLGITRCLGQADGSYELRSKSGMDFICRLELNSELKDYCLGRERSQRTKGLRRRCECSLQKGI